MKTPVDYLKDILDYLDRVERFVDTTDDFFSDERTQYAVIRAYEVIGEIVKRLPEELLEEYPQVNWKTIRRFRDFLAHNYEALEPHNLWAAIQDIPTLRETVEKMLKNLSDT